MSSAEVIEIENYQPVSKDGTPGTLKPYAARDEVRRELRNNRVSILRTGFLLSGVKKYYDENKDAGSGALGTWGQFVKGVGFAKTNAERYINVSQDTRLSEEARSSDLPHALSALEVLTDYSDDQMSTALHCGVLSISAGASVLKRFMDCHNDLGDDAIRNAFEGQKTASGNKKFKFKLPEYAGSVSKKSGSGKSFITVKVDTSIVKNAATAKVIQDIVEKAVAGQAGVSLKVSEITYPKDPNASKKEKLAAAKANADGVLKDAKLLISGGGSDDAVKAVLSKVKKGSITLLRDQNKHGILKLLDEYGVKK
jgi:hypothetical protein